MTTNRRNLITGHGTLYVAPVVDGEPAALPEIDDLTPPSITVVPQAPWNAVGYTMEDHQFEYTPTFEDVQVNESNCDVITVLTREEAKLGIQLAERTLQQISLAISGATLTTVAATDGQTGQSILSVGDGATKEYSLLYLTKNESGGSRLVHIPFAMAIDAVNLAFSKTLKPYALGFKVLGNPDAADGEKMFRIYDIKQAAEDIES